MWCTALKDEAGVLLDVYDSHQRGIASAKSRLSIVSTVLVGWAVVVTVAVVILLVVAFTRLRRSRLLDMTDELDDTDSVTGVDIASWKCDAEAGLRDSGTGLHRRRSTRLLESDTEPDDLPPTDMGRLSSDSHQSSAAVAGSSALVSEDELNTYDIPRFVHTTGTTT